MGWGTTSRRGEDGNAHAHLGVGRLEGTLAGKEWFVPIFWNDHGCD